MAIVYLVPGNMTGGPYGIKELKRREQLLKDWSFNSANIKVYDVPKGGSSIESSYEEIASIIPAVDRLSEITKFENIDICFFSTGTWNPKKEKEIDVEQMEDVFKVNFFGTVNSIKAVEQYYRERKSGIITIVSSIAGYRGLPNSTGYGPSKSALNNLAESLYFDFQRYNVRVCLVSPGFIKTPMTDKNDFKMPFLKTPEFAADQIYDGLINKNVFEIHFPKALTLTLKFFSFLPSKLYFKLVGKMTKHQKK